MVREGGEGVLESEYEKKRNEKETNKFFSLIIYLYCVLPGVGFRFSQYAMGTKYRFPNTV